MQKERTALVHVAYMFPQQAANIILRERLNKRRTTRQASSRERVAGAGSDAGEGSGALTKRTLLGLERHRGHGAYSAR